MSHALFTPRRGAPTDADDGAFHALCTSLTEPPPDAVLEQRLHRFAAARWPSTPAPVLWTEQTRTADEAAALISAESRRGLAADRPIRALLVRCPGGAADLVLVARRDALDGPALRRLAYALTSGAATPAMTTDPPPGVPGAEDDARPAAPAPDPTDATDATDATAERSPEPEPMEALPRPADPGHGDIVLRRWVPGLQGPHDHVLATVAAALGVVMGCYGRSSRPSIAVLPGSGRRPAGRGPGPAVASGPQDGDQARLVCVDLSPGTGTAALVAQVRRSLCASDDVAERRPDPDTAGLVAGVVDGGPARAGEQVVAATSAPFPLTLCLVAVPGQGADLTLLARREEVSQELASAVFESVLHVCPQLGGEGCTVGSLELVARPAAPTDPAPPTAVGAPTGAAERIEDMFSRSRAAAPAATAIIDEERSLTYAELDRRAERMADALAAAGVRPGDRVGICLERSVDLVAAMLAVLKVPAVYVPMDPSYPHERLAYIADDAGLTVVVTTRTDLPLAGSALLLDPAELVARQAAPRPPATTSPDDPAYVIYTSGSTGRPKGVVIAHRSVSALIEATRPDFGLSATDTWTFFHSAAFDFSVWEIWGCLLTGARLVVVPYWVSRDPEAFRDLLRRHEVTVLNQTPSAFAQLVEADARHGSERLDRLRLVIFGGEPLEARRLLGWFDRYPENSCRLVNMFGITETTVHVTAQTVTRHEALTGSRSVGRAIAGWTVDVRDAYLRPVPSGAPGEIVVGGRGLALRYLDRPELTAERFVDDPVTGQRLYRSGDLGRFTTDGRLEHLGRIDSQVKIRGFRIELGEIRAVIEETPGVVAAVVVVGGRRTADRADARLDAYVVVDGTDVETVRRRIERLLPSYMMPSTLTRLDRIPLTPHGKLDQRALPDPLPAGRVGTTAAPEPLPSGPLPSGPRPPARDVRPGADGDRVERVELLRAAWEETLGVRVGVHDNFFSLGGNSLLAVRLATTMRERRLPALPLRTLYLYPTVHALAEALAADGDQ